MARRVFYSFHYKPDSFRVSKIRNIGALEDNPPASDNGWEAVTKGGDPAIKRWIAKEMNRRSCAIVLIGTNTARRKWIDYEIQKAWQDGLGVLGVHIHAIKDQHQQQARKGKNPFGHLVLKGVDFSTIVKTYDPPRTTSSGAYGYITEHLEDWVEEAIRIRKRY